MLAPSSLSDRVEEISRSLEELRSRLERVEERVGRGEVSTTERPRLAESAEPAARASAAARSGEPAETHTLPAELGFVGRVLLALGGAYVLRALTESGTLPAAPGIALGLLYGAVWIGLASRAAARGLAHSAVAHGVTAAAVGLPLVWETTVRFDLLPPAFGAVLLFAYLLGLYAVAWRWRLEGLAWIVGIGGFGAAVATMFGSMTLPPFVGVLVLVGVAILAGEPERGWTILAWVTAAGADLGALVLALGVGIERSRVDPEAGLGILVLLPVTYLTLFGVFVLRDRRRLDAFAVVQSAVAVAIGLAGAKAALERAPGLEAVVGALAVACALASYGVAFRVVDRTRRLPFHYFGAAGVVLVLFATELLLARPAFAWAFFVPLAAAAAWRYGRLSLSVHASAFALAAAWASGLVSLGVRAFGAPAGRPWGEPRPEVALTIVATAVALAFPVATGPYETRMRDASRLVLVAVAVWGLGTELLRSGTLIFGFASGAGPDAGALAATRTGVLAVVAIVLSAASRWSRLAPGRWLVYPVLVAGATKLLLEDLIVGRPATLVLSFLAYGTALILAPRLGGKGRTALPG